MSYKVKDIMEVMEEIAPTHLAEPWDNVGLLVGSSQSSVERIMVTLDVTADVIQQAIEKKVDLIISHHPILFQSIKAVNDSTHVGSYLLQLLERRISVYSAHTNYDKVRGGTDDTLAELLGLKDIRNLSNGQSAEDTGVQEVQPSIGRIGRLPEKHMLKDYLNKVKRTLEGDSVDYIGDPFREIQVIASCAGAGGDFIEKARNAGADLFITGEAKYHEMLSTLDGDMALAVFGHYTTEYPAMLCLKRRLQKIIHGLQWKIEVIPTRNYGNSFRRLKE